MSQGRELPFAEPCSAASAADAKGTVRSCMLSREYSFRFATALLCVTIPRAAVGTGLNASIKGKKHRTNAAIQFAA